MKGSPPDLIDSFLAFVAEAEQHDVGITGIEYTDYTKTPQGDFSLFGIPFTQKPYFEPIGEWIL